MELAVLESTLSNPTEQTLFLLQRQSSAGSVTPSPNISQLKGGSQSQEVLLV